MGYNGADLWEDKMLISEKMTVLICGEIKVVDYYEYPGTRLVLVCTDWFWEI